MRGTSADGFDVDLLKNHDQQTGEKAKDLSEPATRASNGGTKRGWRVESTCLLIDRDSLLGGAHGLVYSEGSAVADIEHTGGRFMRRGAEHSDLLVRSTRYCS